MKDIDRAIMTIEQSALATSDDHPDCAMYLNNLGNALSKLALRGLVITTSGIV
jgi:hypothetical protein